MGDVPRLHAVPFQFRTVVWRAAAVAPALPTAVHTVALMQFTSDKSLMVAPLTCVLSGLVAMVQADPFQLSTRLWVLLEESMDWPTASQKDMPAQATLLSRLEVDPLPTFCGGTEEGGQAASAVLRGPPEAPVE